MSSVKTAIEVKFCIVGEKLGKVANGIGNSRVYSGIKPTRLPGILRAIPGTVIAFKSPAPRGDP